MSYLFCLIKKQTMLRLNYLSDSQPIKSYQWNANIYTVHSIFSLKFELFNYSDE